MQNANKNRNELSLPDKETRRKRKTGKESVKTVISPKRLQLNRTAYIVCALSVIKRPSTKKKTNALLVSLRIQRLRKRKVYKIDLKFSDKRSERPINANSKKTLCC